MSKYKLDHRFTDQPHLDLLQSSRSLPSRYEVELPTAQFIVAPLTDIRSHHSPGMVFAANAPTSGTNTYDNVSQTVHHISVLRLLIHFWLLVQDSCDGRHHLVLQQHFRVILRARRF